MADDKKYYVQERKSVTTLSGIKGPADEVKEKDFKGEKSFKALIEAKIIGTEKPDLRAKAEIVAEREEKKKKTKAAAAEKEKKEVAKKNAEAKEEAGKKAEKK